LAEGKAPSKLQAGLAYASAWLRCWQVVPRGTSVRCSLTLHALTHDRFIIDVIDWHSRKRTNDE